MLLKFVPQFSCERDSKVCMLFFRCFVHETSQVLVGQMCYLALPQFGDVLSKCRLLLDAQNYHGIPFTFCGESLQCSVRSKKLLNECLALRLDHLIRVTMNTCKLNIRVEERIKE